MGTEPWCSFKRGRDGYEQVLVVDEVFSRGIEVLEPGPVGTMGIEFIFEGM
jgi:hypothetical protein